MRRRGESAGLPCDAARLVPSYIAGGGRPSPLWCRLPRFDLLDWIPVAAAPAVRRRRNVFGDRPDVEECVRIRVVGRRRPGDEPGAGGLESPFKENGYVWSIQENFASNDSPFTFVSVHCLVLYTCETRGDFNGPYSADYLSEVREVKDEHSCMGQNSKESFEIHERSSNLCCCVISVHKLAKCVTQIPDRCLSLIPNGSKHMTRNDVAYIPGSLLHLPCTSSLLFPSPCHSQRGGRRLSAKFVHHSH